MSTPTNDMTSDDNPMIDIRIRNPKNHGDDKQAITVGSIPRRTLIRFSTTIRRALKNEPERRSVLLESKYLHEAAVRHIITWLSNQQQHSDSTAFTPLSPGPTPEDPHFDFCIHLLYACRELEIPRPLRGEEIRNLLVTYFGMAALSFDEFAMLVDYLAHDTGLVRSAVGSMRYLNQQYEIGAGFGLPEWDKIVELARRKGVEGLE